MAEQTNPWLAAAAANQDAIAETARDAAERRAAQERAVQEREAREAAARAAEEDRLRELAQRADARRAAEAAAEQQAAAPSTTPPSTEPAVDDPVAGPASERRRGLTRFHSTRPPVEQETAPSGNPFLPPSSSPERAELDGDDLSAPVMTSGPAEPTGAPAPQDPVLRIPSRIDATRAYPGLVVQVVGLHGGAGTSTVASLLGREAIDCGCGLVGLVDLELPVVLVARTHARGLQLVKRAAAQWASGGLSGIALLGVVLVDDAPALSKGLHREVKSVERALPHAWHVSWSEDFRHSLELPGEASGGRLRRIRKSLLDQANKLPRGDARGNTTTTFKEGTA